MKNHNYHYRLIMVSHCIIITMAGFMFHLFVIYDIHRSSELTEIKKEQIWRLRWANDNFNNHI